MTIAIEKNPSRYPPLSHDPMQLELTFTVNKKGLTVSPYLSGRTRETAKLERRWFYESTIVYPTLMISSVRVGFVA